MSCFYLKNTAVSNESCVRSGKYQLITREGMKCRSVVKTVKALDMFTYL